MALLSARSARRGLIPLVVCAGSSGALAQRLDDSWRGYFAPGEAGARERTDRIQLRVRDGLDGMGRARAEARVGDRLIGRIDALHLLIVRVPKGISDEDYAARLMGSGDYAWAAPDWYLFPASDCASNDPMLNQQWHLDTIQATRAWELTAGLPPTTIAIVDTGVDTDHPDLAGALECGYESIGQCPFDCPREECTEGGSVEDVNGHGTQVAGVAGAIGNNREGVSGVGWNFRIIPVRVSDNGDGGAFHSDVLQGIVWAGEQNVSAVNVSLGCVEIPSNDEVGEFVRDHGGLLVWAIGNSARRETFDHPNVTVVGGTKQDETFWGNGSYGPALDLVAPATGIFTTNWNGSYAARTGTSYSAAIVTGTIALVRSFFPSMTPDQVEVLLEASAVDLGDEGEDDRYGHGRVDAYRAIVLGTIGQLGDDERFSPAGEEDCSAIASEWGNARPTGAGIWTRDYRVGMIEDLDELEHAEVIGASISRSISGERERVAHDRPHDATWYRGFVLIPEDGNYVVRLRSDGLSDLHIDGRRLAINSAADDGPRTSIAMARLNAGWRSIDVRHAHASGAGELGVSIVLAGAHGEPNDSGTLGLRHAIDPADWDYDGDLDADDLFGFLEEFARDGARADLTGDGVIDAADFFAFLDEFAR